MERVDDLADAAVFVVPDVADAPSLVNWTVQIKGGAGVTQDVLTLQRRALPLDAPGAVIIKMAATPLAKIMLP